VVSLTDGKYIATPTYRGHIAAATERGHVVTLPEKEHVLILLLTKGYVM
jgi:hypothetical protein